MRSILAAIALAVLVAGCAGTSGSVGDTAPDGSGGGAGAGQSVEHGGALTYNGASNGSHTDSVPSDGSCQLHLSANLGSGRLKVTLTTAEGTTVEGSADGPGQKDSTVGDATGAPGTWTLRAERTSNTYGPFTGQYVAHVAC